MTPPILYKYRNWENEHHKKILIESKVWLSSPKDLDDPFDCQLPLVVDENEISSEKFLHLLIRQVGNLEVAQDKWAEIRKNPKEYFKLRESEFLEMYHSFGVFSLCESPSNYLLWSHYANSHQGFCVGFNTREIVNDVQGTFEKVNYQLNFPVFHFLSDSTESFSKALATKHQQWEYEKEWRITKLLAVDSEVSISEKTISEIYFGVKMKESYKKVIINSLKNRLNMINFYEMQLSEESFAVVPKQLNV